MPRDAPRLSRAGQGLLSSSFARRRRPHIENEAERFATIAKPPAGGTRWTVDEANRRVGRQVERLASRSGR
ncbi:DUF6192 family protein [Streptomyces massasporeus]|uniref:DUF6192 family protein n=1 Tax=Streptomyces massasporeus TaxID=67324 RepID=UPI0036EC5BBD